MGTESNGQGQDKAQLWSINADPRALSNEADVLNVDGTIGQGAFVACESYLRDLQAQGAKLNDARIAIHQATVHTNPNGYPTAEGHDLAEASKKLHATVMGRAQAGAARLEAAETQLHQAVESSLQMSYTRTAEGIGGASMITQHVASLPAERRLEFLVGRATAGDSRTIATVLAHPAYLSGLTDEAQETLKTVAASKLAPVEFGQLKALEKVRQRLAWATNDFLALYKKVQQGFDPKRADAKRRAAMIGGVS